MVAAAWLIGYAAMTALAFAATGFLCEGATGDSSGNLFQQILEFASFQACDGLPAWFSFFLFGIFVLPWLLVGFTALAPMFGNAVTGTIIGVLVLTGAAVALVNALF